MHGCDEVVLKLYKVDSTPSPIGEFLPNIVGVAPLGVGGAEVFLWPGKQRAVPRHPPRPRLGQKAAVLELMDEGEQSPDNSGDDASMPDDERNAELDLELELADMLEQWAEIADSGLGVGSEPGDAAGAAAPIASAAPSEQAPSVPEPAPPVPEAAPRGEGAERRAGGARSGAAAVCYVPGGTLAYYGSKRAFEAVCENPAHGKCVATRTSTSKGTTADGFPRSGRPVGFLAAWLARAEEAATKAEHWAMFDNPLEARAGLREQIARTEAGTALQRCERAPAAGEPLEPPTLDGYLR